MKKFLILALTLVLFSACGVGSRTVQSGKADAASISFTTVGKSAPIQVIIDGHIYQINSVAVQAFKKKVDFKQTTSNTLLITPGTHDVKVTDNAGNEIFSKKLFISNQEHRVVEL